MKLSYCDFNTLKILTIVANCYWKFCKRPPVESQIWQFFTFAESVQILDVQISSCKHLQTLLLLLPVVYIRARNFKTFLFWKTKTLLFMVFLQKRIILPYSFLQEKINQTYLFSISILTAFRLQIYFDSYSKDQLW